MDDDWTLQDEIEQELIDKLEASAWDINVQVRNNNVFLHGVVDVLGDKIGAENIVKAVDGVHRVENNLTVAMEEGVVDSEIKEGVESALYIHPDWELRGIGVGVQKGTVYLVGTVKNIDTIERAKEIASQIIGVKEIISQLKVASQVRSDMATLTNSIARALANSGININEVDIDVDDSRVVLQGWARSSEDRVNLEQVVKEIRGVKRVDNHLRIR